MKALILNGLHFESKVYSKIKKILEIELYKIGFQSEWIDLVDKNIEYCTGCGYCSDKNPGVCIKNDDMQRIFPKMANSEFMIFLCPISFGGYNSALKKAVDRYSALGLPTYTIEKGELHHPARYLNPNLFMAIGILDNLNGDMSDKTTKQKETFKLVSERTAISCFASKSATVVFKEEQDRPETGIEEKIRNGFKKMELIS